MRVAYLCCDPGIPIFGTKGAAVHIRELTHALAEAGCELHILAARQGDPTPDGWNLPVHQFELTGWPAIIDELLAEEALTLGQQRWMVDWRKLAYAQHLAQAAQPLLRRLQPDVLYERYSLFSWAGRALAADLGIPHIVEINAPLAKEQARYRQLELQATAAAVEGRILLGGDLVVAVSQEVRRHVFDLGVRSDRVTLMPNGVDADRFRPQPADGRIRSAFGLEGAYVIGFVGSLKPWHGVDGLLSACAGLPGSVPWRLLLVGDGPLRASLAQQSAALGVSERVAFAGSVPHDQIPQLLAAMDVAVAPYPALEGFYFSPMKLFEYMAMARPVVAAALGQIAEVVVHLQSGWLYPPGDIGALREALIQLALDRELRAQLGERARAEVVAHHTWARNAESLINWMSGIQRKPATRPKQGTSGQYQEMSQAVG